MVKAKDKGLIQTLNYVELIPIIQQLEHAQLNHRKWIQLLMRSLVCGSEHPPADKSADAHTKCAFGQWYYGEQPEMLANNELFCDIELLHKRMHQRAAALLALKDNQHDIACDDFDAFVQKVDEFSRTIELLRNELSVKVYSIDPLTGALNRAAMESELFNIHELVSRNRDPASILMIDIDNFKQLNDTYGHPFGDRVLCGIVKFLQRHLRPFDKLFRYGGEEFLISLNSTDIISAGIIAERIRQGVSEVPFHIDGELIKVTISIGVAGIEGDIPVEKIINNADCALYNAKKAGRNRVELATG